MLTFLRLFWEFFQTGLFAIGGGMATIPFLQQMSVKTHWFTSRDLAGMIAVSESTPGPIGINMASYVGYTVGNTMGGHFIGVLGSVISTVGLVTPSVIVILIVARFLASYRNNRYVNAVMYGLRAASAALIAAAWISILCIAIFDISSVTEFRNAVIDFRCIFLAVVIFILTRYVPKVKDLHPAVFIAFSAAAGILLKLGS